MDSPRLIDRRTFIADLGRGTFALAIVSLTGCVPAVTSPSARTPQPSTSGSPASTGGSVPPPGAATSGASDTAAARALRWERVNLGNVSAYILVRGGEAAIVDTGNPGSADTIGRSLEALGLGWNAVAHLVLTHRHGDHVGSAAEILNRAVAATGYAGAEDAGAISVPRTLRTVADGDRVFDLRVVTAPGHTAGSICVFDAAAGLLVAGDAMGTSGGQPILPGAQFTDDMVQAKQSIAKLGALTFETLLVGHGDPITAGASAMVAELARAG